MIVGIVIGLSTKFLHSRKSASHKQRIVSTFKKGGAVK